MGHFRLGASDLRQPRRNETDAFILNPEALVRFTPDVLGLGDLTAAAKSVNAICAIFDLAGFTNFCRQVDPQLAMPPFLGAFLRWLFRAIRRASVERRFKDAVVLQSPLPFYAKFMGDGVLFLWNTKGLDPVGIGKIPSMLYTVCSQYEREFLRTTREDFTDPPRQLRCGVARGQVVTVGNAEDYVGPCMNIASRLQKLGSTLGFAIARRGFEAWHLPKDLARLLVIRRVAIRGIGEGELVHLLRRELNRLPDRETRLFVKP